MIACSHPLATSAGLEVLADGGNAFDAAIAASAVQAVVDPLMTGIGGDCFALVATAGGQVRALNGSGRAPAGATIEGLRASGVGEAIPLDSPHAVTVPGAVSAWCRLHADMGSLPLSRIFAPAIAYAREGYPVTARVAFDWSNEVARIGADPHAAKLFLPDGKAPRAGDRHAQPLLADRLEEIAEKGAAGFYRGSTAESMVAHLNSLGGLHTVGDFADGADAAFWTDPISATYRGHEVFECPPNGQGLAALIILRIIEGFDMAALSPADRIHVHAEATKIAYHHRDALIADAVQSEGLSETLLSDEAIEAMRSRIDMARAGEPALWDEVEHRDTIYLCVVDDQGNAVSFINSIFHPFGSTRLDPASGVLFQNRGASFRMDPAHPNGIAPGKRPMHTIIPGMIRTDRGMMPFGVMGGHYQAAGHAAFLSGVLDEGMTLQDAIDRPRSFATEGRLDIEPGVPQDVAEDLAARGHRINRVGSPIGGAQAIRPVAGGLEGGSDSRKDGMAAGI
ncbi:gamma-glutamyltransferase family protein [Paracoccus sp. C2R09]|nr:gamma-glutamyltransferase family protein [Paracoccus sp. C2R09]